MVSYLDENGHDKIFQEDNAPIHTATRVLNFFYNEGINVMDWPAKSPDLNPIENIWGLMKNYVAEKYPKNLVELERLIKEAWEAICTPDLCKKLFDSMYSRCEAVIYNKGARTKY